MEIDSSRICDNIIEENYDNMLEKSYKTIRKHILEDIKHISEDDYQNLQNIKQKKAFIKKISLPNYRTIVKRYLRLYSKHVMGNFLIYNGGNVYLDEYVFYKFKEDTARILEGIECGRMRDRNDYTIIKPDSYREYTFSDILLYECNIGRYSSFYSLKLENNKIKITTVEKEYTIIPITVEEGDLIILINNYFYKELMDKVKINETISMLINNKSQKLTKAAELYRYYQTFKDSRIFKELMRQNKYNFLDAFSKYCIYDYVKEDSTYIEITKNIKTLNAKINKYYNYMFLLRKYIVISNPNLLNVYILKNYYSNNVIF